MAERDVHIIPGDITLIEYGVIGHQVNCQYIMGGGVARNLFMKYPIIRKEYMERKSWELGDIQFIQLKDKLWVANMAGQWNCGNDGKLYTDINALEVCMLKLKDYCQVLDLPGFVPKNIGCGLGGEHWEKVRPMMQRVFPNCFIIDYMPGVKPSFNL